jgi:co-chaperonin GroES (HSP10)
VRKVYTGKVGSGLLFASEKKEERPCVGFVIAKGAETTEVEIGDYVAIPRFAGTTFKDGDEKLSIVKESDVLARLDLTADFDIKDKERAEPGSAVGQYDTF